MARGHDAGSTGLQIPDHQVFQVQVSPVVRLAIGEIRELLAVGRERSQRAVAIVGGDGRRLARGHVDQRHLMVFVHETREAGVVGHGQGRTIRGPRHVGRVPRFASELTRLEIVTGLLVVR